MYCYLTPRVLRGMHHFPDASFICISIVLTSCLDYKLSETFLKLGTHQFQWTIIIFHIEFLFLAYTQRLITVRENMTKHDDIKSKLKPINIIDLRCVRACLAFCIIFETSSLKHLRHSASCVPVGLSPKVVSSWSSDPPWLGHHKEAGWNHHH